jgi:hypothetical protein
VAYPVFACVLWFPAGYPVPLCPVSTRRSCMFGIFHHAPRIESRSTEPGKCRCVFDDDLGAVRRGSAGIFTFENVRTVTRCALPPCLHPDADCGAAAERGFGRGLTCRDTDFAPRKRRPLYVIVYIALMSLLGVRRGISGICMIIVHAAGGRTVAADGWKPCKYRLQCRNRCLLLLRFVH